ncbi:MAG: hypothetical protein JNL83_14860 [Myxococcales bacterium]|nr:hypothetical protein [Myxococcales bacterium]
MLPSFNAALVRLGAVELLVVSVREQILADDWECDLVRLAIEWRYHRPVVLLAQDARGMTAYRGRPALVAQLRRVNPSRLPWQRIQPEPRR